MTTWSYCQSVSKNRRARSRSVPPCLLDDLRDAATSIDGVEQLLVSRIEYENQIMVLRQGASRGASGRWHRIAVCTSRARAFGSSPGACTRRSGRTGRIPLYRWRRVPGDADDDSGIGPAARVRGGDLTSAERFALTSMMSNTWPPPCHSERRREAARAPGVRCARAPLGMTITSHRVRRSWPWPPVSAVPSRVPGRC